MKIISFKKFLIEGGNVFKGKTDKIPKAFIEPTLNNFFAELKAVFPTHADIFNTNTFKPLGSVGKKDFSGDIDLAVDVKSIISDREYSLEFLKTWGIDKNVWEELWKTILKRSRTATKEMCKEKAFFMEFAKAVNTKSNFIECEEKKVTNGNVFCNFPQYNENNEQQDIAVQIDFMIGNLKWLMFSYYSDKYEGNVKGLHRTQLLLAAFGAKGKTFNHVNGVKDKETGQVEATNPEEAIDLLGELYNTTFDEKTLANYFSLYDFLDNNIPKSDFNKIKDIYLKILDSTRADIPENLQKYWIQNQDELGLKGKFLPEDSNLISYQKEKA